MRYWLAVLSVMILGISAALVGAKPALADDSDSDIGLMYYHNGEWHPIGPQNEAGTVSPYMLTFPDWIECNAGNTHHVIRTYTFPWNGEGIGIDMKCGNNSFGYNHIMKGKESSWQTKFDSAVAAGWNPLAQGMDTWDDLMNMATASLIHMPGEVFNWSDISQKACSYGWFGVGDIRNPHLGPIYSFYVEVVWSMNNYHVITSYPSTRGYCNVL